MGRFSQKEFIKQVIIVLVIIGLALATAFAVETPPLSIKGRDGAPMMLVPAGTFLMGSKEGDGADDEHPIHEVYLDNFYIDKYEVSVKRYSHFLNKTEHPNPREAKKDLWGPNARSDSWEKVDLKRDAQKPIVDIDWYSARSYCEWAGKRLPTEAEWEKAARGNDGRTYPWGSGRPVPHIANFKNWVIRPVYSHKLYSIDSFERGKSPYGVYNMGGNVAEWVADWYAPNYYKVSPTKNPQGPSKGERKIYRGGSFSGQFWEMRAALRRALPPEFAYQKGIRCAKDAR
jgi:formylglycine-generating enzyme required for sulfatase activity